MIRRSAIMSPPIENLEDELDTSSDSREDSYSRGRISRVFFVFGLITLFSALIVNPWVGRLYRRGITNYNDVMLSYFSAAVICSFLIFTCSFLIRNFAAKWIERVSVLTLAVSAVVLSDRLLLSRYGLPLWIADKENHFRHRPNTVREFQGKLIRINKYGQHDDDFPVEKAESEFRGVVLGDSITMGHGVTREETFSNQLETSLRERYGDRHSFQIINTGVQGYATFQEYNTLVDSLKFQPDFVAIQFCLNDLTEPFVVEKRFGGTGYHYHGVAEEPSGVMSFLVNETGYGRLVQNLMSRGKTIENERKWEVFDTKKAAKASRDDPTFSRSWDVTLSYLEKIYEVARERNIRVLLVISPHTYQMIDERLTQPQKILIEHANSKGVDVLDLTPVFGKLIFDAEMLSTLRSRGFSDDEIEGLYERRIGRYFLDQDHYTVEGHRIVANELSKYVSSKFSF